MATHRREAAGAAMIARQRRCDMIARNDSDDITAPALKNEPIEKTDPNEPIDPIDPNEPMLPIENDDPKLPIDMYELWEAMLRTDFVSAMVPVSAIWLRVATGWRLASGATRARPLC